MKMPPWIKHYGDAVMMPIFLVLVYAAFIVTADANGAARIVAAGFCLVVIVLWMGFRRLRVHAAAARFAGIGEPEPLLELADGELTRRWLRNGDTALHIYRAMAHNLAGRPEEARKALDAAKLRIGARSSRSWQLLWATADIDTRTQLGDAAGARATFESIVVPFVQVMPARGIELMASECEARVRLAEGDAAGARALIAPMVKNIRLGPGARAQAYAILAHCEVALGDAAAASAAAAKARELAPKAMLVRA